MKKLLGIIVLGLLLSGNAYAEIKLFECIAVKDNSIYDKNVRLFDTKKGTYILIKKKSNSEIKYMITQISGDDPSNMFKYKKFKEIFDRSRLFPYKQKLWDDYTFRDWLLLPFVTWADPASPYAYWKHPNNTEGSLVLLESMESPDYKSKGHICKENKNEKISKKEFKKIKKKSKSISAFELIADLSEDLEFMPNEVSQRIIDKEQEVNEKIQKANDINHSFIFEDKVGNKISRNKEDGLWQKFWGTVGWVLYEHGDDILNLAVDLKYGTSQETQTPRMYCVSQKVGKKMVQTSCRQR